MSCSACGSDSDGLATVPGRKGLVCPQCRKSIASAHGRSSMNKKTQEQKTDLAESGGNALLRQQGLQYYFDLAQRSVKARALKRAQLCQ
jgi:hypothetical protein